MTARPADGAIIGRRQLWSGVVCGCRYPIEDILLYSADLGLATGLKICHNLSLYSHNYLLISLDNSSQVYLDFEPKNFWATILVIWIEDLEK
jgi:hypothetical protein